ncbi:unnamed protein product [Brassica oleracea]
MAKERILNFDGGRFSPDLRLARTTVTSQTLIPKKASSFVVLCSIFLSLFGVGSFVLRSMEKMIEREYMCKFCNKKFPSGKSLGGHIRIHTNHYSLLSSSYNNAKNPKKKKKKKKKKRLVAMKQQQQLCCRECGKAFDSLKALWNHMDCCHCEGEKLVMDSQSDTETTSSGPTRKRSKKQFSSESFSNGSSSSSACEIDQEHKNSVLSLMMMSMDSRGLTLVVNSLVAESSENNSDGDDNGAILYDSYSSDSDYFMNGPKRSDSAISVDGCLSNNGDDLAVKEGRSKYELRKSKRVVLPCYESDSCAVDTNSKIHSKKAISANKNGKCHECPFCFRVFKSGQALGGHKRSHSFVNQEHRVKHKAADMRIDLNRPAHDIIVSNSETGFPSIRGLRGQKARYLRDVSWWANDKDAELLRPGYVKPEVVSWSPQIIVLHNFLSSGECEYLKAIARPRLQVSTVVDIKTGKILDLYNTRADLRKKDHLAIDKYALRGLRSLAVAKQTIPEKTKKKALVIHGNSLVGCLCLILHDMIVHTPLEELQTSVSTSVITGDQLAISSETRLKLGMGSNMYPYHQLLYLDKKAIRGSLGNQVMFF